MPTYRYRAVQPSGRIAEGTVAAANENELTQYLSHSGLELIEARVRKETKSRIRWPRRTPPRALAVFASQTEDLLKADVPFVDALRDVAATAETGAMRDALADTLRAINHGSRIADAFARHTNLFPPVFTAILAAGEASGDLTGTFAQLTRYAESRARTSEQLRRALRYPLFLLLIAFGVVGFMMTMVVPQLVQFLSSIGGQLPPMTRFLIAVSGFFCDWWPGMIVAPALGVAALGFLHRHSEQAAQSVDGFILRVPVFGNLVRQLALTRFMHSFAILFQSGVGVVAGLRSARATLGNRALEAMLDDVERQVQSGRSLSLAMTGIFPAFAVRMIGTGEHSGQLGKSLNDIAAAYDREAAAAAERMIGALEPALTILIGAILAWVVLAVLGPVYGSLAALNASR